MASPSRATSPRQRHEEVRLAVRKATLELFETARWQDLTVDEIARAAGLSRSAFYFYFRDKHDLLIAAANDVAGELYHEADRWWSGEGSSFTLVREALGGVVGVYVSHAAVLRVAADVSTYDDEVGELWRGLLGRFIEATAEHLRAERAAGRLRSIDPDLTAASLVWMLERTLYFELGRGQRSPEQLVDALSELWHGALYPEGT